MVLSEKEIIESLHDEGMVNCLLCNQTAFEKRIGSAIFKSWKKWIDTSAHNAPPPDFFSDKLKMMFDVTTIYDSEVPSNKRPDKMWNPVLSKERNEEHKARDFIRALGIDSSEMYIFCKVVIPLTQPDRGADSKGQAFQQSATKVAAAEAKAVLVQVGL